jgi:hypothetical protein
MPSRLLREGILSSDRVDQLDFPAEVFYRRLMSKVDDHGLYDARPSILRTSLYPLRVDRVREADISRWIAMCEKAGLIALYSAGGKPYLKMLDTRWEARSKAKYPEPDENGCKQVETPVPVVVVVDEGVVGRARKRATPPPESFEVTEAMATWATEQGLSAAQVIPQTERFLDHYRGKGQAQKDWDATWRNWIRKAVDYRSSR